MTFEIKIIKAAQTLPIRQLAMWPNKPLAFVKIENDETGRHFGLFANDKLISVVSVFVEQNEAHFRKFATLPECQGMGYGSKLLKMLIETIEHEGCEKVWCNARINKTNYYERFGLKQTTKTFERSGRQYVVMERTLNE